MGQGGTDKFLAWGRRPRQPFPLIQREDIAVKCLLVNATRLIAATLGFSLLFGGVVLARMRTILADAQTEARLRRKAANFDDAI